VTDASNPRRPSPAEPPVRDSGPVEGVRGNREVPPTDSAATAEQETPPVESPEDALGALQAERDELFDRLQRVAADFDNFRKRAAREQAETITRANERLVKELLPVLDDLGRALEAAAEHEEAKLEEGVRLVHRSLVSLLEREGLEPIGTDGRFDPHVHEALLSQPSEQDEGAILQVIQPGYRLGDRVLRPARVVVSAGPPEAPEEA
jgi:molecular chaperone GrpE